MTYTVPHLTEPFLVNNKYNHVCNHCGAIITKGTPVLWWRADNRSHISHVPCWEAKSGLTWEADEADPDSKAPESEIPPLPTAPSPTASTPPRSELDEKRVLELIYENSIRESSIILTLDGRESRLEGFVHKSVPAIAETLAIHRNVYIWGAAGSGKTTMSAQIATLLTDGALEIIQCGKLSPESTLKGFVDGHGNRQEQRFIEALQRECVIFLDEFDRWPSHLTTLLNSTLANGYIDARGHGAVIKRHDKCYILAAGNTTMRGRDEYFPEAIAQEFSTIDRFFYFHVEYDLELERGLSAAINPNAGPWARWVQTLRPEVMSGKHGKVVATPRASYEGAKMLRYAKSLTVESVADGTVFKGIDAATKSALLTQFPLPIMEPAMEAV